MPNEMPAIGRRMPWHYAPRRWGHRLHAQCSYMAMFPPALPHFFIRWLTVPGEVVYDPFSGRGTSLLEARLLGRIPMGSDLNPLARLLSWAKVSNVSLDRLQRRIEQLGRLPLQHSSTDVLPEIRTLFSENVLSQVLAIRQELDCTRSEDRFLLATMCGILHGNAAADGTPRGLTVSMPNTFAMAPNYVKQFIRTHKLRPPELNVAEALKKRVAQLDITTIGTCEGHAWLGDARSCSTDWPSDTDRPSLILTSPPYLHVMKYGKLNWIRTWLIGGDPKAIDATLFASGSVSRYLFFMKDVIRSLGKTVRADGHVCLVIGDVVKGDRTIKLAHDVAQHCIEGSGLTLKGIITDHLPVQHKVSRIWGKKRGSATKTDRIVVLAGPRARKLQRIPEMNWAK